MEGKIQRHDRSNRNMQREEDGRMCECGDRENFHQSKKHDGVRDGACYELTRHIVEKNGKQDVVYEDCLCKKFKPTVDAIVKEAQGKS